MTASIYYVHKSVCLPKCQHIESQQLLCSIEGSAFHSLFRNQISAKYYYNRRSGSM